MALEFVKTVTHVLGLDNGALKEVRVPWSTVACAVVDAKHFMGRLGQYERRFCGF